MIKLKHSCLIRLTHKIPELVSLLASSLILAFRPLLGPALCKFEPTCTKYAIICLAQDPLPKALWLIARRLISCNPFYQFEQNPPK